MPTTHSKSLASKIAIGSAQFGLNYGITNHSGIPSHAELENILCIASKAGISTIDTAIAYGESEKNLGLQNLKSFKVISKLSNFPSGNIESWCIEQCYSSIKRLGITSLYGILLHRPEQLLSPIGSDIISALNKLKTLGLVEKIGISIYSPSELDNIYSFWKPEIIQSPFNAIDQRLKTSGWIEQLYNDGIEVHIRSLFLQGLLLQTEIRMNELFPDHKELWAAWHNHLKSNDISALQACLEQGLTKGITNVVLGIDNAEQLKKIIDTSQIKSQGTHNINVHCEDEMLINPTKWKHS